MFNLSADLLDPFEKEKRSRNSIKRELSSLYSLYLEEQGAVRNLNYLSRIPALKENDKGIPNDSQYSLFIGLIFGKELVFTGKQSANWGEWGMYSALVGMFHSNLGSVSQPNYESISETLRANKDVVRVLKSVVDTTLKFRDLIGLPADRDFSVTLSIYNHSFEFEVDSLEGWTPNHPLILKALQGYGRGIPYEGDSSKFVNSIEKVVKEEPYINELFSLRPNLPYIRFNVQVYGSLLYIRLECPEDETVQYLAKIDKNLLKGKPEYRTFTTRVKFSKDVLEATLNMLVSVILKAEGLSKLPSGLSYSVGFSIRQNVFDREVRIDDCEILRGIS